MKKITCFIGTLLFVCLAGVGATILTSSSAFGAADCSGPWQVLRNTGGQSPCRALGLDSQRGTCRPGDAYETLCDSTTKGRYRICQGPTPCGRQPHQRRGAQDCTRWDYDSNRPCPPGYFNHDCRGGCGPAIQNNNNNCSHWDYKYNQPCPPGFINRDCRGACER